MIILRVVDLTVELTDLETEFPKYANLRTHIHKNKQDNKLLFQIIGQIHGAMLLNIDLFTLSCRYQQALADFETTIQRGLD